MVFSQAQHEYLETKAALREVLMDLFDQQDNVDQAVEGSIEKILAITDTANPFRQF